MVSAAEASFAADRSIPDNILGDDDDDVNKLIALRRVAYQIKVMGSMIYREAAQLAVARRAQFFCIVGENGIALPFAQAPLWRQCKAGWELALTPRGGPKSCGSD